MSWAANRDTKRTEDRAYSLLGIFDVTMPLVYGEGEKAFRRLQEEIIRQTSDLSLLAWRPKSIPKHLYTSLLATTPDDFEWYFGRKPLSYRAPFGLGFQISLGNNLIRLPMRLDIIQVHGEQEGQHVSPSCNRFYVFPVALKMNSRGGIGGSYLGIPLRKAGTSLYLRDFSHPRDLHVVEETDLSARGWTRRRAPFEKINLAMDFDPVNQPSTTYFYVPPECEISIKQVANQAYWDEANFEPCTLTTRACLGTRRRGTASCARQRT
jgi:hypothetical protein